ncbi:MAG: SAM-dependent methyltransferase [Pseudomonadota bacterium]
MTLQKALQARIAQTGPITVADYMADALLHPTLGYYTTRDPLGTDFITAPEISQMFGELLGLSLAQSWLDQGQPAPFTLAELGPGRGTLMADMLRAAAGVPGFLDAAQVHLVEVSPTLRAAQAGRLAGHEVTWLESANALPDQTLFVIANEFFDALPIRQFLRDGGTWRERMIGLDGDRLAFGLGPAQPQPALAHRLSDTKEGELVEDCPSAAPIVHALATRIAAHGGAGLIIDYGDWRSLGDTLQALRKGQTVSPLDAPGTADLTAHVDFEALAKAAAPAQHARLTPQGVFLERLGITARAQALATRLTGDALAAHIAAHRRLTHPEEMGNLFKVLALYPEGAVPPPGCTP